MPIDCQLEIVVDKRKTSKIYHPKANSQIGPKENQFRDCLDISIKLAFGLIESEGNIIPNKDEQIFFDEIYNMEWVKSISNSDEINKNLPSDLIENNFLSVPFRIAQSSDSKLRKKVWNTFNLIEETLKKIENKKLKIDIRTEYSKKFSTHQDSEMNIIEALKLFADEIIRKLILEINEKREQFIKY